MKPRWIVAAALLAGSFLGAAAELRIGLIGLDTSHVIAFTKVLNDPAQSGHVPGGRVLAAFKGGSPDIESSRTRVDDYTRQLQEEFGVQLYDTIEELCAHVDAVMLESVDGRPHLWQAIPVILAGKPLFIDKPMAGSLGDVLAIFKLAAKHGVPVFSASSLRYGHNTQAVRQGAIGRVLRAETTSPFHIEPKHPDLFWYGIHGVESLFTVMGRGCVSVTRGTTDDGLVEVTGVWDGGRVGVYRESKGYGGRAEGERGTMEVGAYDGYAPLVAEVMRFFRTGIAPVAPEETIELFAFMEAADESQRREGAPVALREVYRRYGYEPPAGAELVSVRRIWDEAPHNAFTDLVWFQDEWICAFREGQGHVSPDGALRVIGSKDGVTWDSLARLTSETADLRDPKLSITPNGRLLLVAAAAMHPPSSVRHQTMAWFSNDGRTWDAPVPVGDPDFWLWRVTWHDDEAYGVGYQTAGGNGTRLYRSANGKFFRCWVPELFTEGQANEASLAFAPDGTGVCLLRRDGEPGSGQIGMASPPYRDWKWQDLGVKIGGPKLLRLPDGRYVAGVRLYDGGARMSLAWVDPEAGTLQEFLRLPSGGDTSYPGMVWRDGLLWVSYYASHEGQTAIYLARVKLPALEPAAPGIAFDPPAPYRDDTGTYASPLVFNDGRRVKSAADWAERRQEIREYWDQVLGEWPPLLTEPRLEVLATETSEQLRQERVRVTVAPNRAEEGWLLVPPGRGPFPAVLIPYYEPETSAGRNPKNPLRDFGYQLAKRGFVTLSIGSPGGDARQPDPGRTDWQPLSFLGYVAANCLTALAARPEVDGKRIGVLGHSYGGKWALFAAALDERFACCVVSDPGIVWDESRPNVNYWEPWYLGRETGSTRRPGVVTEDNPRTGAYRRLVEEGHDLHELHALLAPRPLLVSGGAEDPPERWQALNRLIEVNEFLGFTHRVAYTQREGHSPTVTSNEQIYAFLAWALQPCS